jgi:hypothetical protein
MSAEAFRTPELQMNKDRLLNDYYYSQKVDALLKLLPKREQGADIYLSTHL